ncbi:hypothetical protein HCH_03823 [Hahella chejuensis KCTC 2396]|uniref:Uncharacterized protein n=1 Tax=Hahella chejuensis (strain KCTC 2396) TaxID=349521 RepID=Q2SFM0_HAHCH|nr:hypothetical protein HCH_03823 [Hahella chejuensis KCTC 2396]
MAEANGLAPLEIELPKEVKTTSFCSIIIPPLGE